MAGRKGAAPPPRATGAVNGEPLTPQSRTGNPATIDASGALQHEKVTGPLKLGTPYTAQGMTFDASGALVRNGDRPRKALRRFVAARSLKARRSCWDVASKLAYDFVGPAASQVACIV